MRLPAPARESPFLRHTNHSVSTPRLAHLAGTCLSHLLAKSLVLEEVGRRKTQNHRGALIRGQKSWACMLALSECVSSVLRELY